MLRNFHGLLGFDHLHQVPPASRYPDPATAVFWPAVAALRTIFDAFHEALAAQRQYEHLRSRGLSHNTAVAEALGVSPSKAMRETAKPLYFVGKA